MRYKNLRLMWLLVILALSAATNVSISAQQGEFTETFDDPSLPGWDRTQNTTVDIGVLHIEREGYAFHPSTSTMSDLRVRVNLKGDGFIEVRYLISESGMYILRISHAEVVLLRESDGTQVVLASVTSGLSIGKWGLVEVEITGNEHHICIEPGIELQATDNQPLLNGSLMLHVFGDAVGEFDDLFLLQGGSVGTNEVTPPTPSQTKGSDGDVVSIENISWVRTGGPPGGLGYDIRYNFDNPDIWYVTDLFGGVHISLDNGLTWQPSNAGIPRQAGPSGDAIPIFSLTVDPHDPQIIWAGTDPKGHIYKSIDGGISWTQKDNGVTIQYDGLSFRGFTVDPQKSSTVYAMAETIKVDNEQHGGVVYKTTDGGDNWHVIWDGGYPSSLTRYMWINPQNPDILYVSTGIFDRGAIGDDVYPWGGLGILKSSDGGITWRILNEANGLKSLYIGSLFMHPENPDILLAGAGHQNPPESFEPYDNGDSPMGVYRTTDGGEHWTQVIKPPIGRGEELIFSVEICLSDPNIAYAGGNTSFYRSQDAGMTWVEVAGGTKGWGPPGGVDAIPIDLQCDPRDVNRIFANNYKGGNYLSEDGGHSWKNASTGYTGAQVVSVIVDQFDPARVYSVGRNGAWRSDDGGAKWYGILSLKEGQFASPEWAGVALDPTQKDRILLGGEGIFESLDGGKNWTGHHLQSDSFGPFAVVIVFAPSDPNIVYAGAGSHNTMIYHEKYEGAGLSVSRDGGSTWENAAGNEFKDGVVMGLAVDPENSEIVYAATQSGLFKSADGGKNWSSLVGLPKGEPTRTVAINPADSDWVLTGVDRIGLFLSMDGGSTWKQVSAGLEQNSSFSDIVFDPSDPIIVYLCDLMSGVYRSSDGGLSWLKINTGLTTRTVTNLSLSNDGNHLYAATNGEGIFRLDLNGRPPFQAPTSEPPIEVETEIGSLIATPIPTPTPTSNGMIPCASNLILAIGLVILMINKRKTEN